MKYIVMGASSNFGNMFSMAAASLFLPFLPMLPTQILLNNFLYDASQVSIPSDDVDTALLHRPKISFIHQFMMIIGPISSLYDFLTFGVLFWVFHAASNAPLFRTAWFVESLATQTLVVFVIRTAGNPFKSRPSRPLLISGLGCRRDRRYIALHTLGRPAAIHPAADGIAGLHSVPGCHLPLAGAGRQDLVLSPACTPMNEAATMLSLPVRGFVAPR
jgi:Mg2+-importing ATPase